MAGERVSGSFQAPQWLISAAVAAALGSGLTWGISGGSRPAESAQHVPAPNLVEIQSIRNELNTEQTRHRTEVTNMIRSIAENQVAVAAELRKLAVEIAVLNERSPRKK
jgi:hypothetical protein